MEPDLIRERPRPLATLQVLRMLSYTIQSMPCGLLLTLCIFSFTFPIKIIILYVHITQSDGSLCILIVLRHMPDFATSDADTFLQSEFSSTII